ncbi:hypothetical protein EMIHUDRAFT_205044 [Emiliania huxleyi CCMP1516]|uniref:Uncharacterized protein n=2 Tax=Emiliania huxleyi TaxID=2903 RepID=A0A0D3JUD4_EMIH1|nr:hypothetical protein EMIHUDRAFT_205044 [Emiliania huxleyi CCMP1516]EOD27119.1 hypothetical protein EMIHUDRAFT_205044 [Emiliania huxleyi CCMP1516]|eukprot:XP_005779548.1 hypothetical protein EMIHUDRAFT_205044 [Emiliania huxleyi CCMP1516]
MWPARPVEAGLGPARDGWPPTSALALLVKMAAVSIAATGMSLPRFDPAAKSCCLLARTAADSAIAAAAVELSRRLVLICCLPAVAAGEPGGPLYYKDVLTRFYLEIFYLYDSERECIRGILWVV